MYGNLIKNISSTSGITTGITNLKSDNVSLTKNIIIDSTLNTNISNLKFINNTLNSLTVGTLKGNSNIELDIDLSNIGNVENNTILNGINVVDSIMQN